MSKTYLNEMARAKTLIAGLRKNADWAQKHNIGGDDLSAMEQLIAEGEALNASVDELREKLHGLTQEANAKLTQVKRQFQAMKREVKMNVDSTRWLDYGVLDKR